MTRLRTFAAAAGAAVALSFVPTLAYADSLSSGVSGYEIFPGAPIAGVTYGATFAGWTTNVGANGVGTWQPFNAGTGGYWTISINYSGNPGVSVQVKGGRWTVLKRGGGVLTGSVLTGTVVWISSNSICAGNASRGANVASVNLNLSPAGHVNGCLDDLHFPAVFPPQVWGEVAL